MVEANRQGDYQELRRQLDEAESTLSAIRNGEVDALVIGGKEIYTLEGADHPYRVLVEAMQHGAVTLSPDGVIIYCNTGFAQMIRRPCENLIGVAVEELFADEDRSIIRQRLADNGQAGQSELTLSSNRGSPLPVVVSFNRLPLNGVSATCLIITDLTEHRHNQHLRNTDRRKDEFLAMLAHELRNPLAPIMNAAQLLCLQDGKDNPEIRSACEVIDRQVRQMTRIVDDLLDVSRITRGKISLQVAPTDVESIIAAAVETSRPLIEARRHTLHVERPAEALCVNADPTRMAQVITNLLNNAAKYTEEGGNIWLAHDRDGLDAKITVRDDGVGMSKEMLSSVFDLFTQADRTIDRSQGGLGIGLTLVRRLVEMHRGSVSAASDGLGRGSEFVVRLPLQTIASELRYSEDAHASNGRDATTAKQRVLVVDDNVDSANSMAMMLRALGHESLVAHDGLSALKFAKSFNPSLVLLDLGLPGMNGYMVAEQMRQTPTLGRTLIVALTGYGDDSDRRRSKAAGCAQHFVKPMTLSTLQKLISSLHDPLD